jgi:ribosomal protein L7/L12
MNIQEMVQALRNLPGVHYTAFGRLTMGQVADALETANSLAQPRTAWTEVTPVCAVGLPKPRAITEDERNVLLSMMKMEGVRNNIPVIKRYREMTNCSLKEAVEAINKLRDPTVQVVQPAPTCGHCGQASCEVTGVGYSNS